jgi:hypothetical protein
MTIIIRFRPAAFEQRLIDRAVRFWRRHFPAKASESWACYSTTAAGSLR